MNLTRLQYKALKNWRRYHTTGYSVGQFVRTVWLGWLALAIFCSLIFFLVFPCFPVCLGLCLGAFFRDIGYYKSSRKIWPVTQQIVEWNRVNEMIESHEK